ncbi:MAG: hypothetical protein N5P05_001438 [Chroococcopsis gigantea SAG 12.99]|nr:competence protein ComE [Chlorogloea purpurea SAG 13.99]MDV2999832.1 hypothetical protein [Chroococcopsis gigantea SAG 12.99]
MTRKPSLQRPFICLFWGVICLISGCRASSAVSSYLSPLPQDPLIEVYFNHNGAKGAEYTDPYRQVSRPGDNLEQIIVDTINSAEKSIDVAVQELRLPNVAQALVAQHQKGRKVRVILENIYNRSLADLNQDSQDFDDREQDRYQELFRLIDSNNDKKLSQEEINTRDAIEILKIGGVPVIDDRSDRSRGSGLMHHKFILVDRNTLIVTSANFTLSDIHGDFNNPKTTGNANHLLKIKSPGLVNTFKREFGLMWGDEGLNKFGVDKPYREPQTIKLGDNQVTVKFSPNRQSYPWKLTTNGVINDYLDGAQKSVNLALFVFTEQNLANTLEIKHDGGVQVKALIDPGFAFREYSEGLDMLGVALNKKCQSERDNRPWGNPINTVGVPNLEPGDKLHHKFGLIDESTVVTGSHNWSKAANYQNDETLIVIQNPVVAAHFKREFERLYKDAKLGLPQKVKSQIEKQQAYCSNNS